MRKPRPRLTSRVLGDHATFTVLPTNHQHLGQIGDAVGTTTFTNDPAYAVALRINAALDPTRAPGPVLTFAKMSPATQQFIADAQAAAQTADRKHARLTAIAAWARNHT